MDKFNYYEKITCCRINSFFEKLATNYDFISDRLKGYSDSSFDACTFLYNMINAYDSFYYIDHYMTQDYLKNELNKLVLNIGFSLTSNLLNPFIKSPFIKKGKVAHNRNENNTPENRKYCYEYTEKLKKTFLYDGDRKGWQTEAEDDLAEKFNCSPATVHSWTYQYKVENGLIISRKKI